MIKIFNQRKVLNICSFQKVCWMQNSFQTWAECWGFVSTIFKKNLGDKKMDVQTEIPEQSITDWNDEPEAINFLNKQVVQGMGGIILNVKDIVKRNLISKAKKEYIAYSIYCNDGTVEYRIGDLMRSDMKWGKISTPKKIHVSVEKRGEYLNWIVKPA